jgi:hypothetical protein
MKNYSILILLSIFILCACKKENGPYVPVSLCPGLSNNMDTINKYIGGAWEFVEEKRVNYERNAFVYYTPNSTGWYHLTLKLSGDTAKFFVNGFADSTFGFKILRMSEVSNYPDDSFPILAYYSFFTGIRRSAIPIMVCEHQLLMQLGLGSDVAGDEVWIRK